MELENTRNISMSMTSTAARQTMNILCCMCGISFNPQQSKTNICVTCLSSRTDITQGITKQGILNFCRMCRRYLRPPWVYLERESRDLLTLCLKKIKGLNKVKLIDAQFVWTEPHSRRIKIRLTIQAEVVNKTSLQHTFEVEFFEHYMQCDDCKKEFTPHQWGAVVQVRQRVPHKRTFYFLEQQILKNNAHQHLLKIEEKDDGLDFFYKSKAHANKLVDYLQTILPMKIKASKQLISYDEQNDIYQTKYTWSAEIPKVCKDDLIIIPPKLCKELGGCCPLLLCIKLSTTIRLLEPKTMKRIEVSQEKYQHYEADIKVIQLKNNCSEFQVNDFQKKQDTNLNESYVSSISNIFINKIYDINVSRTSDWENFDIKTHLGNAIKVGAILQGYDLTQINYEEIDKLKNIPEIIIVKRIFPKDKRKQRIWKLNRIDNEGVMVEEGAEATTQKKANSKHTKKYQKDAQEDFEEFMDDIEFDKDLQKNVRLYKNKDNIEKLTDKQRNRLNYKKQGREGRKVVVVKTFKKQETNIFNLNKDNNLQTIQEDEGQEKQEEQKTNKVENKDDDNKSDSSVEEAGVKLFQLEEWFENIKIDDEDDQQENNGENDEAIENFVKDLDKVKLGKE